MTSATSEVVSIQKQHQSMSVFFFCLISQKPHVQTSENVYVKRGNGLIYC